VAAIVPAVDEGADRADELLDGVEGSPSAYRLAGDDPEEHLDEVQELLVGVKCKVTRGLLTSQWLMSSCLWVW
jgi:hypothetical protein